VLFSTGQLFPVFPVFPQKGNFLIYVRTPFFFHGSSFSAETAETFSSPPPIAKKKIYVRRAAGVDTVCFVSSSDFLDAYRIAIDDAKVDAKALAAAMRNKGVTKAQARINGVSLKAFVDIRLKQGGADAE
jgi:hypothetical protein